MRSVLRELKKNKWAYLFLVPALMYTFVFGYATMPYLIIAFQKFNYQKGLASDWVGFANFEFFFKSNRVWEVTRNTILLNVLFMVFGIAAALGLALLINEVHNRRFAKVVQSTMLFPHFLSWVIVSYILQALLSTDKGIFNEVLRFFGAAPVSWYGTPDYWRPILVVARVWKGAGYSSIIYLAAITGIDSALYEAAAIDGASRWRCVWKITLPLIAPTICILALMDIGKIFYGDFGMIYALIKDSGQLLPKVDVIDTYVFRMLRVTGDPSMSMAISLYQSVVGFILVFTSNAAAKKFFPDGALF